VKVFDHAVARTGRRDHEAAAAGLDPVTNQSEADDHKAGSRGDQQDVSPQRARPGGRRQAGPPLR
jgi:hypothetical protein